MLPRCWIRKTLLVVGLLFPWGLPGVLALRAYIGNAGNSTVLVVDLDGPRILDTWGEFAQPWSVAYAEGKVWVAEYVGRPDAPQPAGRVVELTREGQLARILKGANYPMGVAGQGDTVYVASSAVDWTGGVRGKPEILVYGPKEDLPSKRFSFPAETLGYPQSLVLQGERLWVATTWGLLVAMDPRKGEVLGAFSLPGVLSVIRGLADDGQGGLYLSGNKDGQGRVVHLEAGVLRPEGAGTKDVTRLARLVVDGLPDAWGLARVGRVLYLVTSTDVVGGTGPGVLWRLDPQAGKAELLLRLPTRYTLGLAVEE